MDRIDLMKLYTRIYETRSFSRAARDFGTTQPTVSKRLQALETLLGTRLVERNTRGVRPSEAGALYYQQCKRWLAEMEEVQEQLLAVRKGARGRLRLSVPVNIGQVQLARIAFSFQGQYPSVQIDLSLTDRVVDLVDEMVDVAIRIGRLGRLGSSAVVARKLASYRPVLVAAPTYLLRRGSPATLAELRTHRILYYGSGGEAVLHRGQSYTPPPDPDLVVSDPLVLREAIREGVAIGLLSPWLVQHDIERGMLARVLPEALGDQFFINAVYLPSRTVPARIRAFLAHCAVEVPRIPGVSPP
ncbi:MAG TPA: LysR family transcriptional regulator [Polyangia bacterium]|nr:LysR family transcriptional regulator [Polyangia bacterium]